MKKLLLASVSSFALAGAAYGADMAVPMLKAPPPPPASWAGFYLGIDGGAVRQDAFFNDLDGALNLGTMSTAKSGGQFGGYAGYNWQDRSFVYGFEADINGLSAKATETWGTGFFTFAAQHSQDVPWVATFRGRMGIDVDATLFYLTGGLALGKVENSFSMFCNNPGGCFGTLPPGATLLSFNENTTRWGWTAGVGFEHLFAGHWTLRGELRYVDLGVKAVGCTDGALTPGVCITPSRTTYRSEFSNTLMNGLVGLGYKF